MPKGVYNRIKVEIPLDEWAKMTVGYKGSAADREADWVLEKVKHLGFRHAIGDEGPVVWAETPEAVAMATDPDFDWSVYRSEVDAETQTLHEADKQDERPCQLYRHYNAAGELLYVGISLNVLTRTSSHRYREWFSELARIEVEHYPTRGDAMEAELKAIREESPLFNIAGKLHE